MALKKLIKKEEFDKLPEHFKNEYISDGEGGYKLDVEGDEDTGALKRALLREKENSQTTKARLAEVEKQLEEIEGNDARKNKDIAVLEKQWNKTKTESDAQFQARIDKLTSHANKNLIDNVALQVAQKLNPKNYKVLLPHIKERIKADFEGDEPTTVILDTKGQPSKLTTDELYNEFVANPDFKDIIIGSKANGGAGSSAKPNGGAGNNQQSQEQPADLSKLSPKELAARITERKAQEQESQ